MTATLSHQDPDPSIKNMDLDQGIHDPNPDLSVKIWIQIYCLNLTRIISYKKPVCKFFLFALVFR